MGVVEERGVGLTVITGPASDGIRLSLWEYILGCPGRWPTMKQLEKSVEHAKTTVHRTGGKRKMDKSSTPFT